MDRDYGAQWEMAMKIEARLLRWALTNNSAIEKQIAQHRIPHYEISPNFSKTRLGNPGLPLCICILRKMLPAPKTAPTSIDQEFS